MAADMYVLVYLSTYILGPHVNNKGTSTFYYLYITSGPTSMVPLSIIGQIQM